MEIQKSFPLAHAIDPEVRKGEQDKNLRDAAKMYEQYFLGQVMRSMRGTVPESGLLPTSMGEKIFREQLDQQHVEAWSDRGGVGLADMIYNHVKERYLDGKSSWQRPQGPLPLTQDGLKVLPLPNSTWRLELPGPSGAENRQVLMPWSGRVVARFPMDSGEQVMDIAHGEGLRSRLVFAGQQEKWPKGEELAAGTRVGQLAPTAQGMLWQISRG